MPYRSLAYFSFLALLLCSNLTWASSTFRCNSRLVSLDASTAQVREKCGAPASSTVIGYKEIVDDYGFRQEVVVEEWIYGPNHGMYYYLRFEGNRLRGIDSRRGN
ncbi:DUF2845 domain-containing protein [Stutzerimonas stutzeri]|uniref:DUF2845 domain-containing protein n=1 Tax=Stutzerimonas sp. S1 TaxID=3030652 RepID=UPI002224163C|nr:DUF2845 domain-containing protein [Stutzerimonas sp. S1]MCW3150672.1 DUF2845 domain-containing protein [Stutzerimonas sp. S1]